MSRALAIHAVLVVFGFVLLVLCESLCVLFAILEAPSGRIMVRCFQYADIPVPPANRPPVAQTTGPYRGLIGQTVQMDASGSSDPEGSTLSASWDFGDGAAGTGLTTGHAYANIGVFNVSVTVSDGSLTATAVTTATIIGIGRGGPDGPDNTPM